MPSLQLQSYLQARADGATMSFAAEQSGISIREAELHEADIASGDLKLPEPRARAHTRVHVREATPSEERTMANSNVAADELRLLIERIDRLDEERKGLAEDIADVFKEAKSRGFDTWAMKEIRKWRRLETHTQQERAAILELYAQALGVTVADAEILKAA